MRALPNAARKESAVEIEDTPRWTHEDALEAQGLGWGVYVPDLTIKEAGWLTYPIGQIMLRKSQTAGEGFHVNLITEIATRIAKGEEVHRVEKKLYLNHVKSRMSI